MTEEVKNKIIEMFWGIVPQVALFMLVAAALGIGYKILEKKLLKKAEKIKENRKNKEKKGKN